MTQMFATGDPLLDQLTQFPGVRLRDSQALKDVVAIIRSDPELSSVVPEPDELDPFFMVSTGGGARQDVEGTVEALVDSARQQMAALNEPSDQGAFVRHVLENYDELRHAVRGEEVRTLRVLGLAGVTLPTSSAVTLPWGIVRPVGGTAIPTWHPVTIETRAALTCPELTKVSISRDARPDFVSVDEKQLAHLQHVEMLTPLAFAVATSTDDSPAAPITTMETTLIPFVGGFSYSTKHLSFLVGNPAELTAEQIKQVERWAKVIQENHDENLDVAARRIVSAISSRDDRSDALIDAVTAWESLVGTRSETVFRVTASLAILLKENPEGRLRFRKDLSKIYDMRSKIVHGEAVDQQLVSEQSNKAIQVALLALRAIYERGSEWVKLKSSDRSDRLILSAQ